MERCFATKADAFERLHILTMANSFVFSFQEDKSDQACFLKSRLSSKLDLTATDIDSVVSSFAVKKFNCSLNCLVEDI
jgi:hypothetical protein